MDGEGEAHGDDAALLGRPEPYCARCKYDLRHSPARICPECGRPRLLAIAMPSPDEFERAATLLHQYDLLVSVRHPNAGPAWAGVDSVVGLQGIIWIRADQQELVRAALGEAAIDIAGSAPLVDRAEPVCPHCGAELDPAGEARCPSCGGAIEWVEIEEPDVTHISRNCRVCGYELRGLTSERCPECGAEIPVDLDALVKAATEGEDAGAGWRTRAPGQSSARAMVASAFRVLAWLGLLSILPAAFLLVTAWASGEMATWELIGGAGLLGFVALVLRDLLFPPRRGRRTLQVRRSGHSAIRSGMR
jgi:predicted amidophosphoribosyltransferase